MYACRYGEYYGEMTDFHELLPRILKPGGLYSFFNGLASDNYFFHLTYGRSGYQPVAVHATCLFINKA